MAVMRRWNRQLLVALVAVLSLPGAALAQLQTSTSYSMNESQIGGNGLFNSGSTSYQINPVSDDGGESLGASAVGNSSSTSYQTNAGFDTTEQPGLMIVLNSPSVNLGTLSQSLATFATATFDVRDYTSYGYVVQIVGSTPSNSGHNLTALTTDTASSAGTEQFGINTVYNTVAGRGANPVQVPSSAFSFGVAGDGTHNYYTQSDKYRFNSGETIASSPKTSGDTTFTVTFLANMSTTTPGGVYSGNLDLVATGTF
jgi:hypothetical protein